MTTKMVHLPPKTKKNLANSKNQGGVKTPLFLFPLTKTNNKQEVKIMARKPTTSDKISAIKMGLKIYSRRK